MLFGFVGRISTAASLKDNLDVSAERARAIASRVARASLENGNGFALPSDPATAPDGPATKVDLETEMIALADEQLRYEATAKLLHQTYQQLRASLRDR